MKELIAVESKEIGLEVVQAVSARTLYEGLGLNITNWSKWARVNVEQNEFFFEGEDWERLVLRTSGGETNDYFITLDFAKHLIMVSKSAKSHEYRNYMVSCERRANLANSQNFALSEETYKAMWISNMEAHLKSQKLAPFVQQQLMPDFTIEEVRRVESKMDGAEHHYGNQWVVINRMEGEVDQLKKQMQGLVELMASVAAANEKEQKTASPKTKIPISAKTVKEAKAISKDRPLPRKRGCSDTWMCDFIAPFVADKDVVSSNVLQKEVKAANQSLKMSVLSKALDEALRSLNFEPIGICKVNGNNHSAWYNSTKISKPDANRAGQMLEVLLGRPEY